MNYDFIALNRIEHTLTISIQRNKHKIWKLFVHINLIPFDGNFLRRSMFCEKIEMRFALNSCKIRTSSSRHFYYSVLRLFSKSKDSAANNSNCWHHVQWCIWICEKKNHTWARSLMCVPFWKWSSFKRVPLKMFAKSQSVHISMRKSNAGNFFRRTLCLFVH